MNATHSAIEWLDTEHAVADTIGHARLLGRLQRDADRLLPFDGVQVNGLKEGVLMLTLSNASLAAKARQITPSLVQGLRQRGWPVDSVKLRPRPAHVPGPPPAPFDPRPPIPASGLDHLAELESHCEPGILQSALTRLLQRRRKPEQGK